MSGSTIFAKVNNALQGVEIYQKFRRGEVSPELYQQWVEEEGERTVTSLSQDNINFSARYPRHKHQFVRRALSQLKAHDLTIDDSYNEDEVERTLSKVDQSFNHGGNFTYIFPEELALLHAVVKNTRPKRAVFMGSYYGYWAIAAKSAFPELHLTLLDVNAAVMQLAKENFERLNLAHNVDFVVDDAETYTANLKDVDLLVLDAEGPRSDDIHPDYRDKAIYYPHLKAALPSLSPGAFVISHNVVLANFTNGKYFDFRQRDYRQQYAKFLPLLREHFDTHLIDSTEGTLIARKK